ncbi:TIGR03084 family metal-binding protein [Streptomyces sp. NBC_00536]|uniref:TIGR03084 family metal-binding protein n=1 Tax=Streptomyces sp. NBC_00536 TaxID=2975769 RepID=UPI002E81BC70|nr:TIGR03084 family metal-binding protein [Streptomyces sp. NBC_00536]WUC80457.1 TIGR03084 family metal-binding protein [Streptomyces sp. NBC_00536]
MSEPSPPSTAAGSSTAAVYADLRAEARELDLLVADLPEAGWAKATPAPGWSVAHQIAHLAWTDRAALLALTDAAGFGEMVEAALAAPDRFVDDGADAGAALAPAELLAGWRAGRTALDLALAGASPDARFPWYGPPMKAASMASARLMETWAHGQDVADALGVRRTPTDRLRHVARIGVRARDYAFAVRGLPLPVGEFRVELAAPDGSGDVWAYGPVDAPQRVTGPALDFCLLVTQRAHRADLGVRALGADAERWLDIAQAFAGPAGPGRAAGGGPA